MAVHDSTWQCNFQSITVYGSTNGVTLQNMTRFALGRPPPNLVCISKRFIACTTIGNRFKSLHPQTFILWHSCPSLSWHERPLVSGHGERLGVASAKAACGGQSLRRPPPPLAGSLLQQSRKRRQQRNQRIELYVKLYCASCVNLNLPTEPINFESTNLRIDILEVDTK
jgi:hypothetical protein